jgi:superfamily II DNA/RNA helicase
MSEKKPFTELGLSPETLKAVERMGFEEATPSQSVAIPVLLGGATSSVNPRPLGQDRSLLPSRRSKKVDPQQRTVQALILCPTRELAMQVAEEVAKLPSSSAASANFRSTAVQATNANSADCTKARRSLSALPAGDRSPRSQIARPR